MTIRTAPSTARPEVWERIRAGDLSRAARLALVTMHGTVDVAVQAEMHAALGTVELRHGNLADARDRFDHAAALAGPQAPLFATWLAQGAMCRCLLGDPGTTAAAQRAQREGKRLGDVFARCEGYHVRALVAMAEGRPAEALDLAEAAEALRDQVVTHVEHPMSRLYVGLALLELDRGAEAQEVLEHGLAQARADGAPGQLAWFHGALALAQLVNGQWDAAESTAEAGERAALSTGTRIAKANPTAIRALVSAARGDLSLARSILEADAGSVTWAMPGDLTCLARAAASRSAAVAHDHLLDAWLRSRAAPYAHTWRILLPLLTAAALRAGDRAAAERYAAEAVDGAARAGTASARGAADVCRALVHSDVVAARAAIDELRQAQRPIAVAQAILALTQTFVAGGARDEGRALLAEAHAIFVGLGLTRWAARAGRELVRLVSMPEDDTIPGQREPAGWERLSPVEREVAFLVAQGLTNPQVAARLVLSPRTVQTHTSHIYAKLGLTSRVQLATLVTQPTA